MTDTRSPGSLLQARQTSPLVAGPPSPEALAADHRALHARAARRTGGRPRLAAIVAALACLAFLGYLAWATWPITASPSEPRSLPGLILETLVALLLIAFFAYLLAGMIGRRVHVTRAVQAWADVLRGTAGTGDAGPAAEWMSRFWPWFAPPQLLENETAWACGSRRGRPVLLISEHIESFQQKVSVDSDDNDLDHEVVVSVPARLSIFIAGAALRDDAAAHAERRELFARGYGLVQTPAGVYVHGVASDHGLHPTHLLPVLDGALRALQHEATPPAEGPIPRFRADR